MHVTVHGLPIFSLGADTTSCGQAVGLSGPGGFTSYLWSDSLNMQVRPASNSGTYSLTVTDSNGCKSADTVQVTIFSANQVSLGADTAACGGPVMLLSPSGQASHLWSTGANSAGISVLASGPYWLEVTDSNGCIARDTLHVTVHGLPIFSLGADTVGCAQPVYLQGPSGLMGYLWSDGAVLSATTALATGDFWLRVTDSMGCLFIDTVHVTISAVQPINIGGDTAVCPNTSFVIYASPPMQQYLWSSGSSASYFVVTSPGGLIWCEYTDSLGCKDRDTILVQYWSAPQATFSPPPPHEFCAGQQLVISGPPGCATYLWNNVPGSQSITLTAGGTLNLTVVDSNGCSASGTTAVWRHPLPNASVTVVGDTLVASPVGTYEWFLNGSPLGLTSPWIVPAINGSYAVQVTDTFGCSAMSQGVSFAVGVIGGMDSETTVWPNPSSGTVRIALPHPMHPESVQVILADVSGRQLIPRWKLSGHEVTVDLSLLPDGVYLLIGELEGQRVIRRIVLAH